MASLNTMKACTVCNKKESQFCSRCKSACYCSKTCQKDDWPTHKLLCEAYSKFEESSRPSYNHYRAIFFPVDKLKPKLVWIESEWDRTEFHGDVWPFLGPNPDPARTVIQHNKLLKRDLLDTIQVYYNDGFLFDGSRTNASIATILNNRNKQKKYYDWRGPVIAFGKVGLGFSQLCCRDLDMSDFRHIADGFLAYHYEPVPPVQQAPSTKILGVRINCNGDRNELNRPHFEAIEVLPTDSVFVRNNTSDIAALIDLPILTRKYSPDQSWANNKLGGAYDNQDATYLHVCCKPEASFKTPEELEEWGWAPEMWRHSVGSVIVARQDRKPLSVSHMEALCRYCRYEVHPTFAHVIGEYAETEPMSIKETMAMINKPAFMIYWYEFVDEKSANGQDIDTSSPYDI